MTCLRVEFEKSDEVFEKIKTLISGLDENLQFKVMLVCEEIITNQIRHADFGGKTPDVRVCFDLKSQNGVVILFKDNAKKFNLIKKEDPDITKSLDDTKPGGLGIFLVKKYAKKLSFDYQNGYNTVEVEL